jgi:ribose-phosphate pyrophosphokinase
MILNLVNPKNSDIGYKISRFPDGQQTIDLVTQTDRRDYHITIKSRLNNFKDLEIIICATAALKNLGFRKIELFVPYFMGARSDRKFIKGGVNYLKDVVTPIINSQGYERITVVDPHSDVLEALITNFDKISNQHLVSYSINKILNLEKLNSTNEIDIISPDAGAVKRVYDVSKNINFKGNIITASKQRNISGDIIRTEVPGLDDTPGKRVFVIIDDICDGGRTFNEISKAIREVRPRSIFNDSIYLIVTHGIFSAGLLELSNHFNKVFTTNSFSDINVEEHSDYTVDSDFVEQLNVFQWLSA